MHQKKSQIPALKFATIVLLSGPRNSVNLYALVVRKSAMGK